jgi:MFS family permease
MRPLSPLGRAVLAGAPGALLGAAFGFGKIVRDCALTCNVGFEWAPLAILGVALATVPLSALRVRLETSWGYRRWHIASTLVAAASFFAFRALTHLCQRHLYLAESAIEAEPWDTALHWTYLGFFVWVGALAAIVGVNASAHVARLFPEDKEKGFRYVALGVVLGGVLGSWAANRGAGLVIERLGWPFTVVRDNLMIATGLVLLLGIPLVVLIDRWAEPAPAAAPGGRPAVALRTVLAWIREDGRLARMGLLILVAGVADTAGKYLFYWLVSEQFQPDPATGRTLYFATFYLWLNLASLTMLAFGTSQVIGRLGLGAALLALPAALSLGTAALAVHTLLIVMYVLRVVEGALQTSLYGPGVDHLYVRLEDSRSELVRPVLNGLVARVGEGLGAVLILVLTFGLHVPLRAMVWVYLVVLLGWTGVVLALPRAADRPSVGVPAR